MDCQRRCLNDVLRWVQHIFSLCWFASELLSVFIFLLVSFTENLQYRRFCLVLILTSNVQLHLSTLQVGFFFCFFSTLWPKILLASKKIKYVSFLFDVIRFAASFRLVDHIGENHVSAQFQISPMLCMPKFFFLMAGINFNTIFSHFGRFPN